MIVVADTGPIHYLILSNCIDLVRDLFGSVLLPPAVHRELLHSRTPQPVRLWAESLPPWADVQAPSESARFLDLGSGEREAIQLALDSGADFVLMDESVGRRVARQAGVRVKGTLGVLEDAADRNLIELREAIERLRATNIFIAEELIDGAVRRHETRRRTDDGPATSPTKGRDAGPLR